MAFYPPLCRSSKDWRNCISKVRALAKLQPEVTGKVDKRCYRVAELDLVTKSGAKQGREGLGNRSKIRPEGLVAFRSPLILPSLNEDITPKHTKLLTCWGYKQQKIWASLQLA